MLETNRLKIVPLTHDQLLKYIKADNSLETALGLNPTIREMSKDLKEALELSILPNVADPTKNYLFSTLWTIILKAENKMVADLCFVGEPNAEGAIEIGYGTYENFRGKGYMTEAVAAMIHWATQQPLVKIMIADTEKQNMASSKILEKNHFQQYAETETLYRWRLELEAPH